jgi:lysozyme family protein
MAAFEDALDLVLKHEGGYVNHPKDPGGETNYGISKRAYPEVDIRHITEEEVASIYRKDYWEKIQGDSLPPAVALLTFDFAVNAGARRASKALQSVVHAVPDGIVGIKTIKAVKEAYSNDPDLLAFSYKEKRQEFYMGLRTYETFGKGWTRRNIETYEEAIQWITKTS